MGFTRLSKAIQKISGLPMIKIRKSGCEFIHTAAFTQIKPTVKANLNLSTKRFTDQLSKIETTAAKQYPCLNQHYYVKTIKSHLTTSNIGGADL